MRTRLTLRLAALSVLLLVARPPSLHAQNCDVMVTNGSWSLHPDPDSIYVNFYPDVSSAQAQNPRLYDLLVNMRYGAALVDQHTLQLRWSHGIGCPGNCAPNICEEKEWSFKGVVFRDQSKCTLNAQQVCGCPPLGDPVMHRKAMPKPPVPVTIEIEIIPLNLQGCNPINPQNDRVQFAYPGSGPTPIVPAVPPALFGALLAGLMFFGILRARQQRAA